MRRSIQSLVILTCLASTAIAQPNADAVFRNRYDSLAKEIDRLSKDLEEFGTVSISTPLLAKPRAVFHFDLQRTAKEYYTDSSTSVQGAATAATQIAHSLALSGQGSVDQEQMVLGNIRALERERNDRAREALANAQQRADRQREANDLVVFRAQQQAYNDKQNAFQEQKIVYEAALERRDRLAQAQFDKDLAALETNPEAVGHNPTGTDEQKRKEAIFQAEKQKLQSALENAKAQPVQPPRPTFPSDPPPTMPVREPSPGGVQVPGNIFDPVGAPALPELLGPPTLDTDFEKFAANGLMGLDAFKDKLPAASVPPSDLVVMTESAKSIQGLLNFFHDPQAAEFADKKILFGGVTVALQPGWRTKENFAGQVTMRTRYVWVKARDSVVKRVLADPLVSDSQKTKIKTAYGLGDDKEIIEPRKPTPNPNANHLFGNINVGPGEAPAPGGGGNAPRPHSFNDYVDAQGLAATTDKSGNAVSYEDNSAPLISGISPLMESDVLDLASDFKRLDEFTLALALSLKRAGAQATGKLFDQYVKAQQKQVRTRNASPRVSAFSHGGGIVGFQIGPRLKALRDPASRKNESANMLDRQALPALLVFGLDLDELYPKIDNDGFLWEPTLLLQQFSHWVPIDRYRTKFWDMALLKVSDWPGARWSETERARRTFAVENALGNLNALIQTSLSGPQLSSARTLRSRAEHLKFEALGSSNSQFLPAEFIVRTSTDEAIDDAEIAAEKATPPKATPPVFDGASLTQAIPVKEGDKITSAKVEYVLTGANLNAISNIAMEPTMLGTMISLDDSKPDGPATVLTKEKLRVRLHLTRGQVIQLKATIPLSAFGGQEPNATVSVPLPSVTFTMPN